MPHIPNADHQMKSIILALMALFFFLIYNAMDSYNVVHPTEAQQQEDQVGILNTNSTTSSNATTSLSPTELFSRVQDSVVQVTTTNREGYLYLYGIITIKNVSKEISFPFTQKDKDGGILFEGEFILNRRDFGVGGKSFSVADDLSVELSIFARKN